MNLNLILKGLVFFSLFTLLEAQETPDDQLLVVFGSSGYVLYKVLDFANDHGYRYIKILSYQFKAFEHEISGVCKGNEVQGGRYFELRDENVFISFVCFNQLPNDIYIIDLEKYRALLD